MEHWRKVAVVVAALMAGVMVFLTFHVLVWKIPADTLRLGLDILVGLFALGLAALLFVKEMGWEFAPIFGRVGHWFNDQGTTPRPKAAEEIRANVVMGLAMLFVGLLVADWVPEWYLRTLAKLGVGTLAVRTTVDGINEALGFSSQDSGVIEQASQERRG